MQAGYFKSTGRLNEEKKCPLPLTPETQMQFEKHLREVMTKKVDISVKKSAAI